MTGDFQRPPYVIQYAPGLHVKDKGKLSAQIIVEDTKLTNPLEIPETLSTYSGLIVQVAEVFERFLEMQIS